MRRAVVQHVADRIESIETRHPRRVAIDGPDAAGKTTLADELADVLAARGRAVIRASIDGFHRPRADRYRRGTDSALGYYDDSFDYDKLRDALIAPLGPRGGRVYRTRVFDHRLDRPVSSPPLTAAEDAILLFDGVFLLRPELVESWDLRIFVTAPFEEIVRRARRRDRALLGSADDVEQRYRTRYIPGQEHYLEAVRPLELADIVIANDDPDQPVIASERTPRASAVRRVLVTGMSGTGKSTVLAELARRGFEVVDTDDPGWSTWSDEDGGYIWAEDRIAALLSRERSIPLYVSGTVSNQGRFYRDFDAVVLLSAPAPVLLQRLATRTTNDYGKSHEEQELILRHVVEVEPLLRATCTHELDATQTVDEVVAQLVTIGAGSQR